MEGVEGVKRGGCIKSVTHVHGVKDGGCMMSVTLVEGVLHGYNLVIHILAGDRTPTLLEIEVHC